MRQTERSDSLFCRLQIALLALLISGLEGFAGAHLHSDVSNITRLEHGDTFSFKGAECIKRECGGRGESLSCSCICPVHAPLFREDKGECVEDLTECSVAPFGFGSSSQRIPYVFLPLKGQIIHPSKEISFPGVRTPICAVSGAQFLTRNGFVDLRNTVDSDVPFSLFRDEGRTFLQWTGETEVRSRMEGRLLVVHLLCRDVGAGIGGGGPRGLHGVFTPCAAFRVAGSPAKHVTNVSEVLFSPDARSSDDTTTAGLTVSEYVAIGISSVLLGLIYVASVFLYLHIKRKRGKNEVNPESPVKNTSRSKKEHIKVIDEVKNDRGSLTRNGIETDEDGVVKNNPLLGIGRHFHTRKDNDFESDSGSCPTDADDPSDEMQDDDPKDVLRNANTSLTVRPIIHHEQGKVSKHRSHYNNNLQIRDDSGIERLPEENVSIIETFDFRDDKPETVRAMGITRKKLYFNPAYFEPHLLMAPPPAAIEFLTKIREVISIAKHKMESKRFTPSLIGIPEEDTCVSFETNLEFYHIGSQRSSIISLKRENNRRRAYCSGCPGCSESIDIHDLSAYLPEIRKFAACNSCSNGVNKQTSIRKWLEGVPITKTTNNLEARTLPDVSSSSAGLLNSLLSLPKDNGDYPRKYYDFTSRSLYAEDTTNNFIFKKKQTSSVRSEPSFSTFNLPLPNFTPVTKRFDQDKTIAKITDISPIGLKDKKVTLKHSMPDMINEAMAIDKNTNNPSTDEESSKETKLVKRNYLSNMLEKQKLGMDYEADSLERNTQKGGFCTPTEYAEVSSSQASPSLSTALPMDEEMTMRNAIYKMNSRPSSSHSEKDSKEKSPESDLTAFDNQVYSLTDFRSNPKDYNLVTEVYVNNGYNFGSNPTSPSESDCSTFGKRKKMIKGPEELPGHLTIEVKDPPENYIKIHESDGFEPDTLDRKPNKVKINIGPMQTERNFILSPLPESNVMDIKATGIFKSNTYEYDSNKDFSSLKGIYETKSNKSETSSLQYYVPPSTDSRDYEIIENTKPVDSEEGRILTLELRHSKRQRQSTPPSMKGALTKPVPPDVVPPCPPDGIYEYPKPPRKVLPPLPPKNESGRSPSSRRAKQLDNSVTGLVRSPSGASVRSGKSSDYENIDVPEQVKIQLHTKAEDTKSQKSTKINFKDHQTPKAGRKFRNSSTRKSLKEKKESEVTKRLWRRQNGNQNKEDSGYLSTDSNESRRISKKKVKEAKLSGSDTDESIEDARSESGAESIETHSVFFGSLRKHSLVAGSVDSGNGSDIRISEVGSIAGSNFFHEENENFNKISPFGNKKVTRINW